MALHRSDLPIIIDIDSVEIVNMLNTSRRDRSRHRVLVEEIKRMKDAEAREISITFISRSQNKVSHTLAEYGRSIPVLRYGWARVYVTL